MKRKNVFFRISVIATLFISSTVFSQLQIGSFKNSLKENSTDIKDVFPIVNKENNNTVIFIADAKNVYGYKLNPEFKVINKLASESKKRRYKLFIGCDIKDKDYRIFLSNTDRDMFTSINFSFTNKTTTSTQFELPRFEHFIQTIAPDNKLYFLTANKTTGNLFLYSFDKNGTPKKDRINLESTLIVGKKGKPVKIATLLVDENSVNKIEKDTPNAIETVSDPIKMYIRNGKAIISFDQYKKETQLLVIDLATKTGTLQRFKKPLTNVNSSRKKTNSFLYDNYIFEIAADKKVFSMHILEYPSGKFIKEYAVAKTDIITFKNTPIIQEGGAYANYRELEKTKKFLRKITSENIGISVIKIDGNYQFSIGGYVQQHGGGGMMIGGFGTVGGITTGGVSFFINPTMFAYNSFTNTKSTRIEGLFNNAFEHIPNKEIPLNVFDKIDKSYTYSDVANTIFRYKDFFIKGDFKSRSNTYILTKFTE